jgi:hypothetical protein
MKAFKSSSVNRDNHAKSYKLGLGLPTSSCGDVQLHHHSFTFSVKKSKLHLHVDGIIFGPTIGGIVVGVVHTICLYEIFISCLHIICSYHMFIPNVHVRCTYHMFIPHVRTTCSYLIFISHVYITCQMSTVIPIPYTSK